MTSAAKVAAILKKLGDAHYQAADELLALAGDSIDSPDLAAGVTAGSSPPAAPPDFPPPEEIVYEDEAPPAPQGSLAMCPKHRKPYTEGKFGPYCQSTSDDPAWSNSKGFCRITPKNVDVWLRAQAAA